MEARATMRPGQKGTNKLTARFGERLLFVRYRYDAKRGNSVPGAMQSVLPTRDSAGREEGKA